MRHGHRFLSALLITCLLTLTLTGCDDATAPESADTLPEPAAKTYNPDAPDFFQENGDAALAEAQASFESEFPEAKVYGLTFAPDNGTHLILDDWCGSDGDPPIFREEFRAHMENWLQDAGGPEGYTVTAVTALPPGTAFDEAGGLQVQEVNPEELPYFRASANGEVEPLQTQPLPDPFIRSGIDPIPHPFINVFTPVEVEAGILPLSPSLASTATATVAEVSPTLGEQIASVLPEDIVVGEIELEVDLIPTLPKPRFCYNSDPPPDWCWNRVNTCTLSPYLCNIKDIDQWSERVPIDPEGPSVFLTPVDLHPLDASTLSGAQIEVIEDGDRILRPTGSVVESVLMTPDFEGAGVERPY